VEQNRFTDREPAQSDNFFNYVETPHAGKIKVFCHHLRIRNRTPAQPVTNCRVWLVKILDENDRGAFDETFKFAVPRLMAWAPREYSPDVRSFSEDQVFDFGRSFVEQGAASKSVFTNCKVECSRATVYPGRSDNMCSESQRTTMSGRDQSRWNWR
jgi:hypothetical protein